eukprot:CAMPEP_0119110356 /NCGR_PEP_ID=MMETSP1180-20130426/29065_1 /TAXON_ID=3052 ORGANISM="Chlamydomonas cf sp, Strain CCMP681" /NCGR_SAMPLE_ID=MMETSP1180 /ASSEMBLY_ACC=CAM_ASM_000741 /LENGTH=97 /DNA_ID=CAMNT_0007096651 /DNA_START=75 /DNA_END=369 /DNA_ORIENTATION=+
MPPATVQSEGTPASGPHVELGQQQPAEGAEAGKGNVPLSAEAAQAEDLDAAGWLVLSSSSRMACLGPSFEQQLGARVQSARIHQQQQAGSWGWGGTL